MVYDYRPCLFCLRGFPSSQRNQTDEDRAKSKICHVDPCQASEASEAELNQKCSSNLGLPSHAGRPRAVPTKPFILSACNWYTVKVQCCTAHLSCSLAPLAFWTASDSEILNNNIDQVWSQFPQPVTVA